MHLSLAEFGPSRCLRLGFGLGVGLGLGLGLGAPSSAAETVTCRLTRITSVSACVDCSCVLTWSGVTVWLGSGFSFARVLGLYRVRAHPSSSNAQPRHGRGELRLSRLGGRRSCQGRAKRLALLWPRPRRVRGGRRLPLTALSWRRAWPFRLRAGPGLWLPLVRARVRVRVRVTVRVLGSGLGLGFGYQGARVRVL